MWESLGPVLLGAMGVFLVAMLIGSYLGYRYVRKTLRDIGRSWELMRTPEGQKVARLAREIRSGAKRLRVGLLPAHNDRQEAQELQQMLRRFVDRELPESMDRVISLVVLGGSQEERALTQRMSKQQESRAHIKESEAEIRLSREMAVTRQLLEQTQQANRGLSRVTAGLAETARVLRSLEVELAALGAVRTQGQDALRKRFSETAEELRHFREAYLELSAPDEGNG